MLLKRFYDAKLAQASYLVGCAATGEALVIDANRDVDQYIEGAEAEGLRITHVTETHIHADFVSGSRELAARTGAQLYLSDEGDESWKYAFATEDGAVLLQNEDSFRVGNIKVEALHTPGHTPEHLSFMITDTAAAVLPMGVLTGDFIFVGDVGRPDLLERAAKIEGTMEAGARTLFRALQRFTRLPDHLQIWPGHGAGSACGKSLGAVPSSTLGYERLTNWGLMVSDEDEFVRQVLEGQPEPPRYFANMKRINKEGPAMLHGLRRPERLGETRLASLLDSGALVVDTRHASEFAAGHVPGTQNIPFDRSFTTWAGWLVPYDREFYLIVNEQCATCLDEAMRDLTLIGLDRIAGSFSSDAVERWPAITGRPLATVAQVGVADVAALMRSNSAVVIDVRGQSEWEGGHIPGAVLIPLGYLDDRRGELRNEVPVVVHCQSGARSAMAASLLQRRGVKSVMNLRGGFAAWRAEGYPMEPGGSGTRTGARAA